MPHLTLLEKGSGKTHRIDGTEAIAGRDPACAVFLEGDEAKTVSGRHARFFLDDNRWFIEDAGSRNGTYIGTRKLEPGARHPLGVGDVVGLGLTGTQLGVHEAVVRAFAATMLEAPAVPPPPPMAAATVPMRRSEAARAGIRDIGTGDEIRLVLRGVQSGVRLAGQGDKVTVGRALECIIRIEGDGATSVSRIHAEFSASNGKVMIRDGGSRHGTIVNGAKLGEVAVVNPGDEIVLGPGGPAYVIEEAVMLAAAPAPLPAAPNAAVAVASAGERGPGGVYHAELPTPPVARPAAKRSDLATEKPAGQRASRSPERDATLGSRAGRTRIVAWTVVATLAATIAAALLFL